MGIQWWTASICQGTHEDRGMTLAGWPLSMNVSMLGWFMTVRWLVCLLTWYQPRQRTIGERTCSGGDPARVWSLTSGWGFPSPDGLAYQLAEHKFVSAGVSWFPRGVRGKGTDRRAAVLPQLYKTALQRLNTSYHHTADNQTGPLARRLQSFGKLEGLVVGPWGEGSKDLHSLLFSITILL